MRTTLLAMTAVVLATAGCRSRDRLVATPATITLPADGREHRAAELKPASGGALPQVILRTAGRVAGSTLLLRSPVNPGPAMVRITANGKDLRIPVTYLPSVTDSFGDGTPDFLRLHTSEDRKAFRAWFAGIAEAEVDLPATRRAAEIQDCAALLRFAYRQALHAHDEIWLGDNLAELHLPFSSVQQYRYPQTPLGAGLFRVQEGVYAATDAGDGTFAQFADARTLMQRNMFHVGRRVEDAQPGDLLFYRQLEQDSPYHSMIVSGSGAAWVVYHTGPIGKGPGEIRRVAMDDLKHHPDTRWRPVPENSNFLGVYRWNILRDAN